MNYKKTLSILLSASMLASFMPMTGFAENTEVVLYGETVAVTDIENETITFTEYNDMANNMYKICGRNRIDAHTDASVPYQDEQTALMGARDYAKETSNRIKMLTGKDVSNQWDFTVVKNLAMGAERGLINADSTTNAFAATDFAEDTNWKSNVKMPSSWTSYGEWWNNKNTPNGENETWVWDYPIYDNVKMPWQSGEQPYNSDDEKTSTYGTLTPGEAPVKYNPIGFYRTTINTSGLTKNDNDRIRISFQGVESAYYVFIDGEVIGYSEDSFRPHEFDITDKLSDGDDHTLAVRVHKFCDGTWLEDQDMIYDGGIFRDVFLVSVPSVSIEDYKVETDFDENFVNADWVIKELKLRNNTDTEIPAGYTVTANLYDKNDFDSVVKTMTFTTSKAIPANSILVFDEQHVTVNAPKQWSAEKPNLYVMSLNTEHEHTAQLVGFREISFTPHSADYESNTEYDRIKINGQPILMKGTNRHDSDPITGKYVSKEVYDIDLKTMKQFNINTIRTSHYANDEYLYYLADMYGFYVMAETNAECHAVAQRDRGTADVYQDKLFEIFKDRTVSSYQSLKNHSSVVMWSIGNECGGLSDANQPVYYWMADYFHEHDATRPVHSEFVQNRERFDMESNMYPSVEKVQSMASTPEQAGSSNAKKKPYFMCEYAHAMGNAVGDMEGYWNAVRSGTNMIGGCIWDWVDQSRIVPLSRVTSPDNDVHKTDSNSDIVPNPYDYYKDGKYLANESLFSKVRKGYFYGYGGDWGDINFEGRNVGADGKGSGSGAGSFCVNGLVSPDRQPQPELYEVKYQYQSFWFTETPIYEQKQLANGWTTDDNLKNQQVVVYNENNFTNLNEYDVKWSLTENGKEIGHDTIASVPSIEPKQAGEISIPYAASLPETLTAGAEYKLYVEVCEKADKWGIKAGHEIAHEQFDLTDEILTEVKGAAPAEPTAATVGGDGVNVTDADNKFTVTGTNFSFDISKTTGFLSNYMYDGKTLIHELRPNYARKNHNNDSPQIDNWRYANEEKNITPIPNTISHKTDADGRHIIDIGVKLKVPYDGDEYAKEFLRYVIDKSGAVTYRMYLDTTDMPNQTKGGRFILRLGSEMRLDKTYENIKWYGNGMKTGTDGEYGYNYPIPESYRERDTFAVKGLYSSTATDMFFPHMHTQETGTVNNVTWAVMENAESNTALLVTADESYEGKANDPNRKNNALEVSALHYSTKDLLNAGRHPYELTTSSRYTQNNDYTYFNVDHKSLGIGNSSCGPQAREDVRIQPGYIFDYEYTFMPIVKSDTTDAYTAASTAWNAVADVTTADPEFSKEIGHIGYTTPDKGLPAKITLDDAEKSVIWENNIADCEVYEDTQITGTLDDGTVVTGTISVYPDNMYYFVDCNDSDASVFNSVKSLSSVLKNTIQDQTSAANGWGIISGTDAYGTPNGKMTVGDKYKTGYYLNKDKTLDYQFSLEAGKYTVTEGAHEFWDGNASRTMKITVADSTGKELGSSTMLIDSKNGVSDAKAEVGFELTEAAIITVSLSRESGADPVLSWIGIAQALPKTITVQDGVTASKTTAYSGETITLSGNYAPGSLFVNSEDGTAAELTKNDDNTYSFVMPKSSVNVTGLINTDTTIYVVPDKIERVAGSSTDKRNYYIKDQNALGMTFTIPEGTYKAASMHFVRQNTAPGQKTNIYDQTQSGFSYKNDSGYIVQYNGNTQESLMLNTAPSSGTYKLMFAYDSTVSSGAAGNDYFVVGSNDNGAVSAKQLPTNVSQLPYLILTVGEGGATTKPTTPPVIGEKVWNTFEKEFTGASPDYGIVWYKYSGDSKDGSYSIGDNNEMTIATATTDACYGVSAVIKNIQLNTKYTIKFKEKANISEYKDNGFYMNTDTLTMTADNKNPNTIDVAEKRNNENKKYIMHQATVSDSDWEEFEYSWVSGSGFKNSGHDTYSAKFTFILRGAIGTVQVKDLEITGAAAPEPTPTPTPIPAPTKNPDKDYTPEVHMGDVIDPLNTDDVFQYHFAGGTDDYMKGISETGKKYDAYMWVPKTAAPDTLRGLVAIKMNLVEVPLAYSAKLKKALAKQNFGILFIIDENDAIPEGYTGDGKNYKNILQGMYTDKDYKGEDLFTASKWKTWDGKDAAHIMNDILSGIAKASGYDCVAENTPIITIGHSAASPFGYRSGNWAYDRIIAQIDMKNGMWGDCTDGSNAENDAHGYGMVPGIPSLQLAAQYTEHATGAGRDRSVCDARYHIDHQRAVDTNQLVSHIIEWGAGHYDWSNNATDIMIKYIDKAIEYRLNKNADGTDKGFTGGEGAYALTDLTNTGYLMKPFEKDNGAERAAGYYRDTLHGWLSDGKNNAGANNADKKASFWFFDEEFANEINAFTNYAIPESPSVNDTKVTGKTHSEFEPFMLMKNPSNSVYADTKYDFNSYISPFTGFNGNMSRYGNNRFINYEKMENPSGGNGDSNPWLGATNTGNLKGYDTVTADTYYMSKIPSIKTTNGEAYDNVGDTAKVPASTKAEIVPLIAPYELIESELVDISTMTRDGSELAEDVAAVTRNTLRFHNNRVYYNSGCKYTNEAGTRQDAFAMIYSPEVRDNGNNLVSIFKSSGTGMNVPYVDKGKGTDQTLELSKISDVDIKDVTTNPKVSVSYTSSDADLQKYTDVFVNYGPARAVRTVNPTDGSYTWEIEILLDEIPDNAKYPIEVGIVASNLGKWEKVSGAAAATSFHIINEGSVNPPVQKTAVTSVVIDNADYTDTLPQSGEITDIKIHRENDDNLDDCTVYAALYKDGKLAGITLAKITEFSENDKTIPLTSPLNIGDAQELKVFVWNDNMKPMTGMLNIKN